jgi:hypothetical protein
MEGTMSFASSIDILKILKDTRFDEIKVNTEDKPSFSQTSKNTSCL